MRKLKNKEMEMEIVNSPGMEMPQENYNEGSDVVQKLERKFTNSSGVNTHTNNKSDKMKFDFGSEELKKINKKRFKNNLISTTKYNILTYIPKSLILQFFRAANIYFLIISILTFFSFSPKNPTSMVGTFALVLVFTMLKEGYEDIKRYKQDKEVNQKIGKIYSHDSQRFINTKWEDICVGDFLLVEKEEDIPADLLMIFSSNDSGLSFLDTMNLDGETNLKEKMCPNEKILKVNRGIVSNCKDEEVMELDNTDIHNELSILKGSVICDKPNENLEKWTCNLEFLFLDGKGNTKNVLCELKQLLLKGCKLKNTNFVIGIVIYTGHSTKIMKNAKNPPIKVSNVMKVMNILLYSVFAFQLILCILFALAYIIWQSHSGRLYTYLYLYNSEDKLVSPGYSGKDWFIKMLTYLVAYSYLIPISLYVALELVKMIQTILVAKDVTMYDPVSGKNATARTSDLIEELGQVEFVFSDKTGTLTKNEMEFRKCSINNKIYGSNSNYQGDGKNYHGVNGDTRPYDVLVQNKANSEDYDFETDKQKIEEYFQLLGICHSAYVDMKEEKPVYQSSSPDELALLQGAEQMGFKFMKKTLNTIEIENYKGIYQIWDLILELPFDSTRKRMSVIVKLQDDEKYYLFTKGADSAMLKNLVISDKERKEISSHLDTFAKEGLRTLVMGKKILTDQQAMEFKNKYETIKKSSDEEKDLKINNLFIEIETQLDYVGCSAIEDKLQEGVPETIEALMNAEIRLWVLTGDKKETALEIGKSCRLILDPTIMDEIDLASNSNEADSVEIFKTKMNRVYENYEKYFPLGMENTNKTYSIEQIKPPKKIYMIIDGINLAYVLANKELRKNFFQIGIICNSVICCRVSPLQKSLVVKLAKENGKWITLSIGDGANDVPMIMEAHIGIGISGKEGTQAVRSADYAISQFRYLQRLLFVHGRWGYRRISLFICYYFYKNIILAFTEIYFALVNGFSGQIFFIDILPMCYNSFWSSWPCIFNYSFERDVDADTSMDNPVLYKAGQIKYYFNMKKFWTWILMSIIHGAIVYHGSLYGLNYFLSGDGLTKNNWFHSTVAFTAIIHIVNYKIFIELKYWNKLSLFITLLSFIFYYGAVFVMSVPTFAFALNDALCRVIFDVLSYFKAWIVIIALPLVALIPDLFINWISYNYYSNPSDIIFANLEYFKEKAKVKRMEIQNKTKEEKIQKTNTKNFIDEEVNSHKYDEIDNQESADGKKSVSNDNNTIKTPTPNNCSSNFVNYHHKNNTERSDKSFIKQNENSVVNNSILNKSLEINFEKNESGFHLKNVPRGINDNKKFRLPNGPMKAKNLKNKK